MEFGTGLFTPTSTPLHTSPFRVWNAGLDDRGHLPEAGASITVKPPYFSCEVRAFAVSRQINSSVERSEPLRTNDLAADLHYLTQPMSNKARGSVVDSPTIAVQKPSHRSRVTNGSVLLQNVDGRSGWARRMRDLMALHLSDLGEPPCGTPDLGAPAMTTTEIRRARGSGSCTRACGEGSGGIAADKKHGHPWSLKFESLAGWADDLAGSCLRLLREASWHPAIVSVGHRGTLGPFHDRRCDIGAFRATPEPDTKPA